MNMRKWALASVLFLASTVMANQRISFSRQLEGGLRGTFSCDFYSNRLTGVGKMSWYPSAAYWIESPRESTTCKVWAIMPLRRVEQNNALPIWHSSQKPGTPEREPSTRYQIQFLGASAETNTTFAAHIENVFDIDAGDVFSEFGRSANNHILYAFKKRRDARGLPVEGVLCSSGRIGMDGGRTILMYSLMAYQDGTCTFAFSVNGAVDIQFFDFVCKGGKLFNLIGEPFGTSLVVHSSSPALSIWCSVPDTVNMRISYDYKALLDIADKGCVIHLSLSNLVSILEWLAQSPETRGVWKAAEKCSLEKLQIF